MSRKLKTTKNWLEILPGLLPIKQRLINKEIKVQKILEVIKNNNNKSKFLFLII